MAKHDTSRARLLIAMQQFDVYHRGKVTELGGFSEREPWPGANYSGLTLHEGRYYPSKVIVHLANPSFDRSKDQTQMAVRVLEKHGFEFVHFGERGSCPGTCCWEGFPDSRKFNGCLPFSAEEFWEELKVQVEIKRGSEFKNQKGWRRGIEGMSEDGSKIRILRTSNKNDPHWSQSKSGIEPGRTMTGYSNLLESNGIVDSKVFSENPIHNEAIVYLMGDCLEWCDDYNSIRIKSVGSVQNPWPGFTQETFDVYNRILATPEDYKAVHKPIFDKNLIYPLQSLFELLTPDAKSIGAFADFNKAQGSSLSRVQISGNYAKKIWACFHHNTADKKTDGPQFFFTIRPTHFQFGFYRNSLENYSDETRNCVERMAKSGHLSNILAKLEADFDLAIDAEDASENGEIIIQSVEEWINSLMDPDVEPLIRWKMEPHEVVEKGPELFWDVQSALNKIAPLFHLMEGETPIVEGDGLVVDDEVSESTILNRIKRKKFVILEGVPGTGKTHHFRTIKNNDYFQETRFLTFHPSSDYSSFIGGIRPGRKGKQLVFNPTKGHLLNILEKAEDGPVLLWIDELNRANVPRVFGDLISLIGNSDPPNLQILNADLPDNKLKLTDNQKKNLHIVATMNTSDRSVTPLDAALRRRFSFIRLQPMNKQELLNEDFSAFSNISENVDCFLKLNNILREELGEDAILGHSYLFEMIEDDEKEDNSREDDILMIWQYSILPNIVDTLMLTQNFDLIGAINENLVKYNIPLALSDPPIGHGLGEMILIRGDANES